MAGADAHFYEPAKGHGLKHNPYTAIVGPRPIGWISTVNAGGGRNLAPYSYFNAVNSRPPIIAFSSIGWKNTVANVEATGEFVWNLATRALAEPMNVTSSDVPPEIDEFVLSGLTPVPSRLIKAPRVLESPVNFECRLTQLIQLRDIRGEALKTWVVMGEVIAVHIDHAVLIDGVYETATAHPILRAGRLSDYAEITPEAMFSMKRPGGRE